MCSVHSLVEHVGHELEVKIGPALEAVGVRRAQWIGRPLAHRLLHALGVRTETLRMRTQALRVATDALVRVPPERGEQHGLHDHHRGEEPEGPPPHLGHTGRELRMCFAHLDVNQVHIAVNHQEVRTDGVPPNLHIGHFVRIFTVCHLVLYIISLKIVGVFIVLSPSVVPTVYWLEPILMPFMRTYIGTISSPVSRLSSGL